MCHIYISVTWEMTGLTDSYFSSQIMFHTPPPKVIHIRLGNMKIKQLHDALSAIWPEILALNKDYKLVNVFADRIEGVK